jgi:two-component system, NarL family, sensor kinase
VNASTRAGRPVISVRRAVLGFVGASLLVLGLVGVAGVLVLHRVGTSEAMSQAVDLTTVAGRGIVQPKLQRGLVTGNAASLTALDALVHQSVLREPIVGVRIWDPRGRIVYSDVPELIGRRFTLGHDQREALATNSAVARISDLSAPENVAEGSFGKLLEVYLPIRTPDGHVLLYEDYVRFESVASSARDLWLAFLPALAVTLIALVLLQIPLAWRLARRVRESQQDRARYLQQAVDASNTERRRIAGDLHDGPVQELVGLALTLSASADRTKDTDPDATKVLRDAASRVRLGVRSLRSAVMGIYPPSLQQTGLAAALADAVSALAEDGVRTDLDVPGSLELPQETETLLFRASREAIRNISAHAGATRVRLRVRVDAGKAKLEIDDDGRGFSQEEAAAARADRHLGLQLLSDLAQGAGGSMRIDSSPGGGTRLRMEVPIR